jgi:hypothetical protein
MPSPEVMIMMLRNVAAALNQANYTENYAVLHGLMTPGVQDRVSVSQLSRSFAGLRKQQIDLSPAFVLQPQLSEPAAISPRGELRLVGNFPTRPMQINFAVSWLPIDNRWLIETMAFSVAPAPQPATPQPAAAQTVGTGATPPAAQR